MKKPGMIVFSVLDTPAVGGAEENLIAIFSYLTQKGYHVVLATNNKAVKNRLKTSGVQLLDFPYRLDAIGNWKGLLKFILLAPSAVFWLTKTVKTIRQDYPDSFLVSFQPGFSDRLLFTPFLKIAGLGVIWLEHGPLEPTFARNAGFPRLLYMLAKPFVDHTVTISKTTQHSLITAGNLPAEEISIVYPAVPLFTVKERRTSATLAKKWLAKHHLTDKKYIVCVGRLAKEKQFDLAIQAFKQLNDPYLALVIVGDGPEKPYLEKLIEKSNLNHRVLLTGYVSPELKTGLLSLSSAFIFPSAWNLEGFGLTTAEAMIIGVPVITTGAGPQQEIVADTKTGYYFTANDPTSLAKVIKKVLSDSQAKIIAKAGQQFVQTHFEAKTMHQKLEKILGSFATS